MESIPQIIDIIAAKLGVTAGQIIPHYAQYYLWDAWAWLGFGALRAVIGILVCAFSFWWGKGRECDDDETLLQVVGIIIMIALIVIGGFMAVSQIACIKAPQAYAIKQLMGEIRRGD